MSTTALSGPVCITSANHVLSLLDETDPTLRVAALERLNQLVDEFWFEMADRIADIEMLYEDPTFPQRELAALVVSKVAFLTT